MGKFFQRYVRYGKKKSFDEKEGLPVDSSKQDNSNDLLPKNNDDDQKLPLDPKIDSTPPKTVEEHIQKIIDKSKKDAILKSQSLINKSKNSVPKSQPEKKNIQKKITSEDTQKNKVSNEEYSDLPPNLANSLISWQKSNRPVVSASQWSHRLSICRGCQFWMENTQTKMAKCMKCGCGSGKLLLAGSNCPLQPPKWKSV
tara:strand:+ start:172 stop:768 length:597 start_codon:yes stop_codon:yes gene_type:complete